MKKFIFSNNSVQYPSEEADSRSARKLEWKLIRAALTGEPIHWVDGFLIFETWREKEQKGICLDLFRKVASHVKCELEASGIEDIKMGHPTGKLDYWILVSNRNEKIASNVLDAVSIAQEARNAFCQGQISEGLNLVLQSYKTWPNAKALAEALLCAERLPSDLQKYDSLTSIRKFLAESKQNIISALAKIMILGLENKQGVNKNIAQLAVTRWASLLFDTNAALSLLDGRIEDKEIKQPHVQNFISLANQYREYFNDGGFRDNTVPSDIYEKESEQLLQKIINSDFVTSAADMARSYYEEIDYLRKYASMVDVSLPEAIASFIFEFGFPVNNSFNPFPAFCEYLRKYVKMCFTKDGAKNIFESKDDVFEKKKRMISLIKDLAGSDDLVVKIQKIFDKQGQNKDIGLNSKNLKLVIPKIDIDCQREQNLLSYKYCWPETIYGRNEEKGRLEKFVNHPNENLLWWAILGKGGAGKSRLALDLCFKLEEKDWYAGFLMDSKVIDILSDWEPTTPTLIVVDYTYEKAKKLGECINNYMYENSKRWKFPVRILFLERYAKSEALEEFCYPDKDIIEDNLCYHKIRNNSETDFLELRSLDDEAVSSVITEVYKREIGKVPPQKDLEIIKKFLNDKIHENNPLYAMILAEACVKNDDIRNWNVKKLLGRHLERTRKIWKVAGIEEKQGSDRKHINLLTLATMVVGLDIRSKEYDGCLKVLNERTKAIDILPSKYEFREDKYKILCGDNSDQLSSMTPDILSEYFVLDRWKRGIAEECEVELLTTIAWWYKPLAMMDFVKRAVMDFPTDENLDRIIELIIAYKGYHLEKAALLSDLIGAYIHVNVTDKAIQCFKTLEELWKNGCQKSKDISYCLATATVNLTSHSSTIDKSEKHRQYLECFGALWDQGYKDDRNILYRATQGAMNLAINYGKTKEFDKAEELYNYIELLWKGDYQKDKGISLVLAKTAFNLTYYYCEIGEFDKAVEYFGNVESVWKSGYQEDWEVSVGLASTALHMVYYFSMSGKTKESVQYFELINSLWSRGYQKDRAMSFSLANAACNLTFCFAKANKLDRVVKYYGVIKDLINSGYQEDKEILNIWVEAMVNMIFSYGKAGQFDKAIRYYKDIEKLWDSNYKNDRIISLALVKAAANLIHNYEITENLGGILEYYKNIEKLWNGNYQNDKEVSIILADAADTCSKMFKKKGEVLKSKKYKKVSVRLHDRFPD